MNNRIADVFVGALADGDLLPLLTSLAVNSCAGVTSTGIIPFVSSPRFAAIAELWPAAARSTTPA